MPVRIWSSVSEIGAELDASVSTEVFAISRLPLPKPPIVEIFAKIAAILSTPISNGLFRLSGKSGSHKPFQPRLCGI